MAGYAAQVQKSDDKVVVLWKGRRPVNWVVAVASGAGETLITGKDGQGQPFAEKDTLVFGGHGTVYSVVGVNTLNKTVIITPPLTADISVDETMTFTSPVPPDTAELRVEPLTQAEYADVQSKGLNYDDDGPLRWEFPLAGSLTELVDDRPFVNFDPPNLLITEGDPTGSVTLQVVTAAGAVRTAVNITDQLVSVGGGRTVRLDVVSGEATINVLTDDPYKVNLVGSATYQMFQPCSVTCYALGIGPGV